MILIFGWCHYSIPVFSSDDANMCAERLFYPIPFAVVMQMGARSDCSIPVFCSDDVNSWLIPSFRFRVFHSWCELNGFPQDVVSIKEAVLPVTPLMPPRVLLKRRRILKWSSKSFSLVFINTICVCSMRHVIQEWFLCNITLHWLSHITFHSAGAILTKKKWKIK